MTYKKDPKIKYWEMAKYIDDHVREPHCDEQKCFEYMYHLFYVLAVKGKMFKTSVDYDQYALYGATQLFLRYRKENINPDLKPIKSSLNYIKKILYPCRVDYQQENFAERFTTESLDEGTTEQLAYDNAVKARTTCMDLLAVDAQYCLGQISATMKQILRNSPYHGNKVMTKNIYQSCLLTFLKSITMSNKNIARVENKVERKLPTENLREQIYAKEKLDDVVLYHLDGSMRNYVDTLVKRLRHQIAKDLKYLIGSYSISDDVVRDILESPLGDCNPNISERE